jgi:hypothetical protein
LGFLAERIRIGQAADNKKLRYGIKFKKRIITTIVSLKQTTKWGENAGSVSMWECHGIEKKYLFFIFSSSYLVLQMEESTAGSELFRRHTEVPSFVYN